MNDLVSVIMPSYNASLYIKKSIESVLAQTYENFELIVVDDNSSDSTVDIVNSFADTRIHLFCNERNSGAAISRNRALREAKGRWIAFLDADDIWVKDKIEKQLAFMKENNYAFTYTDYRICLNGKWENCIRTAPDKVTRRKLFNWCYFSTITVMYDVNVVGLIQIADLRKNNDYAMWFRALEKTDAYRFPFCKSYYIKHNDSVSGGSKVKLIKHHYLLYRKALEKNIFVSLILTLNNLFFGLIKKFFYKRNVGRECENVIIQ